MCVHYFFFFSPYANSLQFSVRLIVCLDPYPVYEIPYAIKALEFLHTTLLLLHRIRQLGVYTFCTTVYYMLVARKPQFCIMTLCIITFWMYI